MSIFINIEKADKRKLRYARFNPKINNYYSLLEATQSGLGFFNYVYRKGYDGDKDGQTYDQLFKDVFKIR